MGSLNNNQPNRGTGASQAQASTKNNRLIRLRRALKLRQVEMAELVGMSARQYQEWEYNKNSMNQQGQILCGLTCALQGFTSLEVDWPEASAFNMALGLAAEYQPTGDSDDDSL